MNRDVRTSRLTLLLSLIFLAACGGDPAAIPDEPELATGPVLYPDDGISNNLFGCNEAAGRIRDSVELGMTKSQIRAIVGKPRHISPVGEDWRYGTDTNLGKGSAPSDFITNPYYLPVANFKFGNFDFVVEDAETLGDAAIADNFLDDFSGDNTFCDENNADLPFIEAANTYTQIAGTVDFSNEVPLCFDAAVRIAASVEQGMSLSQVRSLVGKPVEVAVDGTNWRYQFGAPDAPYVFFTQYDLTSPYFVTGYSSITISCN